MASTNLNVNIGADASRLTAELRKANSSLSSFGKMAKTVGGSLGLYFGGQAIIGAIGAGIRKIADFEEQMDKVAAVSRAAGPEIAALTKNALDLGAKSKFTATQVGNMQEELARLGFTTPKILAATGAITKLSIASGEELGASAKVMAETLNSFSLSADQSTRVANVMAESFAMSALNMEKFSVAMSNVGATADAAGFGLEETTALLGILTDRGIDASKAGTDLRKIFTDLAVSGMGFDEAMDQISNSTNKVSTAYTLFGQRALTSAIIIADNRDKFRELQGELSNTNRELDNMVDIMEDNLNTDLVILSSTIDGTIQKGGAFTGVLRTLVQTTTLLISKFNELEEQTGGFEKFFNSMVQGVPGLSTALTYLRYETARNKQEQEEFEKALAKTKDQIDEFVNSEVDKAFESGNVEKYIQDLEKLNSVQGQIFGTTEEVAKKVLNREQIIAKIRERQELDLQRQKAKNDLLKGELVTIESLEDSLKGLTELRDKTAVNDIRSIKMYNSEIKKLQEEIKRLKALGSGLNIGDPGAVAKIGAFGPEKSELEKTIELFYKQKAAVEGLARAYDVVKVSTEQAALSAQQFYDATGMVMISGEELTGLLRESVGAAIEGFAMDLGNAAVGVGNFGENILSAIAGFMKSFGSALIASGLAGIAAKALIANPFAAVAAGAALIAASTALTSKAQKAQSKFNSGGSGRGPSQEPRGLTGLNLADNMQNQVSVNIVGKISGQDILFVQEKAQRNRGIRG